MVANLTRLVHEMPVRNDRLKWPFGETLKWSFAEMLIGCFISEAFRWGCMCCVRYGGDLDRGADDWIWWNSQRCIDDQRWRLFVRKVIKWVCMGADQRSPGDVRKSFKWMWCQKCCTWCWDHQMHWRSCLLMTQLAGVGRASKCDARELHLMLKPSDALAIALMPVRCCIWRSCLIARAAFDADAIRCTGGCLDARLLHSTPPRSDERQLMPKLLHPIAMKLDALAVIYCQGCIWCRCHQMHAGGCWCQGGCTWPRTVRRTGEVVCGQMAAPDADASDALAKLSEFPEGLGSTVVWLRKSVAADWLQRHSLWCRGVAPDAEAVGCTGDFLLCLLSGWGADKLLIDDAGEASEMKPDCCWLLFDCQGCIWCWGHQMHWLFCLNFSLIEDSCKDSFIGPAEKGARKKMRFVWPFRSTLYGVDQRIGYGDCLFFHSYTSIFQEVTKSTSLSIENLCETLFIAVFE